MNFINMSMLKYKFESCHDIFITEQINKYYDDEFTVIKHHDLKWNIEKFNDNIYLHYYFEIIKLPSYPTFSFIYIDKKYSSSFVKSSEFLLEFHNFLCDLNINLWDHADARIVKKQNIEIPPDKYRRNISATKLVKTIIDEIKGVQTCKYVDSQYCVLMYYCEEKYLSYLSKLDTLIIYALAKLSEKLIIDNNKYEWNTNNILIPWQLLYNCYIIHSASTVILDIISKVSKIYIDALNEKYNVIILRLICKMQQNNKNCIESLKNKANKVLIEDKYILLTIN